LNSTPVAVPPASILCGEEKTEPVLLVEIKDASGAVVAEVEKVLSVRKKAVATSA
jgi:hypothetical protein